MRNLVGRLATFAIVASVAACGGGDGGTGNGGSTELAITANGSTTFTGNAGIAIAGAQPSVKVTDAETGAPKAGVTVTFAVTGGGGAVAGGTKTTNAAGEATVDGWTLGTVPGANSLRASIANGGVTRTRDFTATGTVGPASRLVFSTNPAAAVTAGAPIQVQVALADQFGNQTGTGNNNITIALGSNPGGSTLGGTLTKPATDGRATFGDLTLDKAGANYRFTASGTGVLTAATGSFFTVNAGAAAAALASAAETQDGEAGAAVGTLPSVRVADAFGNPVAGVAVTFAVSAGGGSVTGATQTTNAQGIATVGGWTLGTAGTNTLSASVAGVSTPVTFNATAAAPSVRLAIVAGQNQITQSTRPVPMSLKVRATNLQGAPLAGRTVTFSLHSGSAALTNAAQTTDVNGIATLPAGSWSPSGAAGIGELKSKVTGGDSVIFSAQIIPLTNFEIQVRFTSDPTTAQRQAFAAAATRWSQVIVGDVANFGANTVPACVTSTGTVLHPAIAEAVDDLIIFATLAPIDGPGQTLGSAGPCYFRSNSATPNSITTITGLMTFDTADLQTMEDNGTLNDVIVHEMGHVLGIGTQWNVTNNQGTVLRNFLQGAGAPGSFFNGAQGVSAFTATANSSFFTGTPVPVEDCVSGVPATCGAGTRDGHWREVVFKNELMTGYISASGNPLSRVTIASLQDMSYTVDMNAADAYILPVPALFSGAAPRAVELRESKRNWRMKGLDPSGRVRQVIE